MSLKTPIPSHYPDENTAFFASAAHFPCMPEDVERRREFYARGGKAIPYIFVRGQAMHGFDVERFERLRATRD